MANDPLDLDWHALTHARGTAADLPDLLRALRSPGKQHRSAAARRLRSLVAHQDGSYDAGAAAVPFLIDLLADERAPDRTLGHELLVDLLPHESLDRLSGSRPHPLGPRLHELADQRAHYYLSRQQEWLRHGGFHPPEINPLQKRVYEAVRAGVPTYLRLLDGDDRDTRGLSAHLLSFFPRDAPQMTPVLTARLAVEQDRVVGSFLCLTAGTAGDPGDAALVAAVADWRDVPGRINRWTVLMGLARLVGTPDPEMLAELCDCLFHGMDEVYGWPFHDENPTLGASAALGSLAVPSAPGLAGMLLEGLRTGGDDVSRFHRALVLLLSLVFPAGPLPDGTAPDGLTTEQHAVVDVVLHSGLAGTPSVSRLLEECNLPGRPIGTA